MHVIIIYACNNFVFNLLCKVNKFQVTVLMNSLKF